MDTKERLRIEDGRRASQDGVRRRKQAVSDKQAQCRKPVREGSGLFGKEWGERYGEGKGPEGK